MTLKHKFNTSNDSIANILALVIIIAWAVSFVVDIIHEGYEPMPTVHALMMIVAGAVFGEGLIRKRTNGGNGE